MGVFDKINSGSPSSSGGGVFGKLKVEDDYNNARGAAEADEQWQVAHQWDNDPATLAAVAPPEPVVQPKFSIPALDYINDKAESVSNFLNRAAISATDTLGFGQVKKHLDQGPAYVSDIFAENASPADTTAERTADIVGNLYGFAAPAMGAYATGGKLAGGVFAKLAPNAPKIVQAVGRGTGAGLAYGAAKEGLDAVVGDEDKTVGNRLLDVGKEALMFGAGDGVFSALGSAVKAARGVADNVASGVTKNALKNVAENSRSSVTSPFVEGVAENPIARGYTEQVGRTFGAPTSNPISRVDSVIDQAPQVAPRVANQSPVVENTQRIGTPPTDELKFAQTVRDSQHTAPELVSALNERPMVGARTSDVLNYQEANKLIEKHGVEGLYSKLMAKTKQFDSFETTAAEKLAKHFGSIGGEENLSKSLDLIAKTGKGGREMGQAIQALTMWNKLDVSGALLLGTRQLNAGVKNIAEYKTLTPAQGAPITEAAQRHGLGQETKNLADEVLSIVTNKQAGEALTDAEKATIKQFQDQVKLINEKGKGFLSQPKGNKANATIKEVSQIEPKERTRDQVVSFLDAKAEKARQRLAASSNIGFAAVNKGNPVIDYAIIGASHIAKGAVKLTDFTEMMVKDFGESVRPHINEVFTRATNMFRKEQGLPTVQELDRVVNQAIKDARFSPEDAKQFKAWASEIGHMSEEFKKEATQDLQFALKSLGESTLGNKASTLQTAAMLLNEITLERNVIGNAAQLIAEKVSKVATVPIDFALSKLTGEQRTIFFKTMNQEKFWKDFMAGTKAGWKGVSPTGTLDSYGIQANVFGEKNPLKYITKSLGAALQGFDYAFYNQAKGEVLATYAENLGKAQGLTKAEIKSGMKELILKLDTRIHELADHAGLYATYQDETLLSRGSEMLKRGLNEASTGIISRKLVDMGMPKSLSMEGFGLGDVVNKYAKTPANLIMRGIDYSPIGFIRSAMDLGTFIFKKEKFNQHQASRTLGRAITGTLGLSGMGFILADAGILTGSSSMDKDVRSIQEQSGQGAYKVNWSALERFFTSNFDYNSAKYQKGDRLMDYAWLQPAAISVAMGVNANKALKDRKEGVDTAGWKVAGKAILGGLQSFLENPMVQGINSVIDAGTDIVKKQDPTKLKNMGKGVPATFVPTILNQFRTATDNNQRETFSKNLLTEMGNLMANKVPGLSNNLPVSYDSMGNARERIQGGQEKSVAQYLTAFFSPAKLTEYQVSPEAKLVLDLMNQSGDQNVLPRIADRYIKVAHGKNEKDLRVDLSSKEFSQLQQTVGKMVTDKLAAQSSYLSDPNRSLESKVKKVKDILTETGQKARDEIGTQMGYKKKDVR